MIEIIYAQPQKEQSRANKALIDAVTQLPDVNVNDIYVNYPDFQIDAQAEQERLLKAKTIICQYPIHWNHSPALLNLWFEKVFTYGWAYGQGAEALKGKRLLWVATAAGEEKNYQEENTQHLTLAQLASPLQQTAEFCGLEWLEPIVLYSSEKRTEDEMKNAGELYKQRILQELETSH